MFGQTVSDSPIRKRRRPALSCVECRRRKIKCDRLDPCNHCRQSKGIVCVYKDVHPATGNKLSSRTMTQQEAVLAESLIDVNSEASYYAAPRQVIPRDGIGNGFTSGESSPKETSISADITYSDRDPQTTPASSIDDIHPQENTLAYRSRVVSRDLPDSMAISTMDLGNQTAMGINFSTFGDLIVQDGDTAASIRTKYFKQTDSTPIRDMQGSISKTRFFGQSHWMHSFCQVRYLTELRAIIMPQIVTQLRDSLPPLSC